MGTAQSQNTNQTHKHHRDESITSLVVRESYLHTTSDMIGSAEIELEFDHSYEFIRVLRNNPSVEIHLVRNLQTRKEYACKIVRKSLSPALSHPPTVPPSSSSASSSRRLTRASSSSLSLLPLVKESLSESLILQRINHPNLVHLHELFETEDTAWIVLEYVNGVGGLIPGLISMPCYNETVIAPIFRQILDGVRYLHYHGIVHRDLKLENILCVIGDDSMNAEVYNNDSAINNLQIKIIDFSSAAVIERYSTLSVRKRKLFQGLHDMKGTKEYRAPEVYEHAYGSQVDIWSLGCILYELLTSELAFPAPEEIPPSSYSSNLLNKVIMKKPLRKFEQTTSWKHLSTDAQSLIRGMLKRNPLKRYDIDECLAHPWITREGLAQPQRAITELALTKRIMIDRSEQSGKKQRASFQNVEQSHAFQYVLHNKE